MPLYPNTGCRKELEREIRADQDEHSIDVDDRRALRCLIRRRSGFDLVVLCAAQHAKPLKLGCGKALVVVWLRTIEGRTTMAECDLRLRLFGESKRGLDGDVAAANHEDFFPTVISRILDVMRDVCELFAGDAKMARSPAAYGREQHALRSDRSR